MSCGTRIYKGDLVIVSIPFDASGYTDLVVSYFTIGDVKIVRTESELEVVDGFITAEFSGHDLDILPDGVLRYTIQYDIDNTDYVESSNTMLYLKTPASYSAMTEEQVFNSGYTQGYTEGYQSGYDEGQQDCPECDCSSAVTEAFQSGYTDGHLAGMTEQAIADAARLTHLSATTNGTYTADFGYSEVVVDTPHCTLEGGEFGVSDGWNGDTNITPIQVDGFSSFRIYDSGYGHWKYQSGYSAGYAQGQADCPECSGSSCNLQSRILFLEEGEGTWNLSPDSGYDGMSSVEVRDAGYGEGEYRRGQAYGYGVGYSAGYDSGYTAGQAACPQCSASTVVLSGTFNTTQSQTWIYGAPNYDEARYIGLGYIGAAYHGWADQNFIDGVSADYINSYMIGDGSYTLPAGTHTFVAYLSEIRGQYNTTGLSTGTPYKFDIDYLTNLNINLFIN